MCQNKVTFFEKKINTSLSGRLDLKKKNLKNKTQIKSMKSRIINPKSATKWVKALIQYFGLYLNQSKPIMERINTKQ